MKQYYGPVVVLLENDSQDALDWAAAEAAARSAALHLVYAFRWPYLFDALGELTMEARDLELAETVVDDAIEHVRRLFPGVRISSTVFPGRPADALLNEARESTGALVVVGHGQRFERRLTRQLARRTTASLAVVGLTPDRTVGPSTGRVVVAADGHGQSDALGFAFAAAHRRGTGLTILHPTLQSSPTDLSAWQTAYPEVDVRRTVVSGTSAVLAESTAAVLTVLTADRSWLQQDSTATVARLARGPVILV
jgi:nucleotide-binding universal stress UspA family protein